MDQQGPGHARPENAQWGLPGAGKSGGERAEQSDGGDEGPGAVRAAGTGAEQTLTVAKLRQTDGRREGDNQEVVQDLLLLVTLAK